MIRRGYMGRLVVTVACIMAAASVASGAEEGVPVAEKSAQAPLAAAQEDDMSFAVPLEEPGEEVEVETHRHLEASAGYRFLGVRDTGGRAAEYDYLHSSFAGDVRFVHLGKNLKLDVDGAFLNRKDYVAKFMFDYAGYYRLTARTESLFHNLDHERSNLAIVGDAAPSARYGITTRQDSVQFRYKLRDYPIHLNLGHWLIDRDGTRELRFSDYKFGSASNNLVFEPRRIRRLTNEGTAGFDAHLGAVNVVYSFLFREFNDRNGTPSYPHFDAMDGPSEHNEDPESRYYSHTVKLYSSPAGGITGAASYSYGRRENRSSLVTVSGADKARDTIQNAAGDFTYSPCAWFTTVLKYRHQEIDRNPPSMLFVPSLPSSQVAVRPGIDTRRDIVSANITMRPNTILSVNGEYQGIFQHRDNTGSTADKWDLPENSDTHKGNLTVLLRPFKGLRLRGLYEYTSTSNPLYDSDPELKHEGRLLAAYTSSGRWGVSASYRVAREWNDHISQTTHPAPPTGSETYVLPRDRHFVHGALGFWVSPMERLTVSGNLGFLRTRADQAVLFASRFNDQDAASEYVSQAEIYAINALYAASRDLDLSLAYQQVRSRSEFRPEGTTGDGITTTEGVRELSRLRSLEHFLSARADYRVTKHFGCSLDYSYRVYDSRVSSDGEGAVHAVTALLKATW
uniref:Outer membrane channel n=1 Tax=Geobacter metallireducens TaxID=28232 RepID=A0A831TZI6_GEOME